MTDRADRLDAALSGAVEAETDPDRDRMEAAVLSTLAKAGPDGPLARAFGALGLNGLAFRRADLRAVAQALYGVLCLDGDPADSVLVRAKIAAGPVAVADAVLGDVLDGKQAVAEAVALRYLARMAYQDRRGRALDFAQACLTKVENLPPDGDPAAAVATLIKGICELAQDRDLDRRHRREADATAGFLADLASRHEARRKAGREWIGLDSGFRHLNEILGGLGEGLFVLAGAPSCGKTTLAKQIADHVAAVESVPVLFWSFEQSAEELRVKSLARMASIDSRRIWKGRTDAAAWNAVEAAAADYRRGPGQWLTIVEAGRADTVDQIRAAALLAKRAAIKAGRDKVLIVIDYLQVVPGGPDAPDTIRERVDWVLSELRRLSRDLQSPILVISAENRDAYRGNRKPTLAALKESGGIEYGADGVICLWRDPEAVPAMEALRMRLEASERDAARRAQDGRSLSTAPALIQVKAFVLKNRNGELGTVKLIFTPAFARFEDDGAEATDWFAALGAGDA